MKLPLPSRVPIIYLILVVLITVGVVPLYFYKSKVVELNRETLERNEKLAQNMVTTSLAEAVAQRTKEVRIALDRLSYSIRVTTAGNLNGTKVESPEIRSLLQDYIGEADSIVPYARLVNVDNPFISVGTIEPDDFLKKELERGLAATQELRDYNGEALSIGSGKQVRTVMVVGKPVANDKKQFLGSLEFIVDLNYLVRRLREAYDSQGLDTFVVDRSGRIVASATPQYATGQDMRSNELVKNFMEQTGRARF